MPFHLGKRFAGLYLPDTHGIIRRHGGEQLAIARKYEWETASPGSGSLGVELTHLLACLHIPDLNRFGAGAGQGLSVRSESERGNVSRLCLELTGFPPRRCLVEEDDSVVRCRRQHCALGRKSGISDQIVVTK